jgi:hypothetical protein
LRAGKNGRTAQTSRSKCGFLPAGLELLRGPVSGPPPELVTHTRKMESATALLAAGSTGSKPGAASKPDPPAAPSGGDRREKWKPHDGRGRSGAPDAPRQPSAPQPPTSAPQQWGQSYNPWTGVVQAWPLQQWRPPKTSVLGPRPGAAPPQALTTSSAPSFGVHDYNLFTTSTAQPRVALLHALQGAPAQPSYGGGGD